MQETRVTSKELLIFFVPLALTSMITMASHSIVSTALARTAGAAAALAAFSVAQTVALMFESPCFALRRLFVSLLDDQNSFSVMLRVSGVTGLVVLLTQMTIAFSPLGRFIFVELIGMPAELLPQTIGAYRVFMLLPVASAIRSTYQGLIIVRRRTHYLTVNIIVRLLFMVGVAAFLTRTGAVAGGAVGAVVLISGMGMEALLAFLTGHRLRRELPEQAPDSKPLVLMGAWMFFFPLVAAQFVQSFDRLFISAGLARTGNAEVSIAAYQVAWSLASIFTSVAFNVHQVVLVFVRDDGSLKKVRRFTFLVGVTATLTLLFAAVTPLGHFVLTKMIGVSPEIARPTLRMLSVLALVPFVLSSSELYAGLLMRNRQTLSITFAKILNLVVLGLSVVVMATFFPEAGGLLATVSMLTGYTAEWIVLFWFGKSYARIGASEGVLQGTD